MRISWSKYVLALLVLFGGLGWTVMHFFKEISQIESMYERLVLPGPFKLDLQSGKYTIFHEYAGVLDGLAYETKPGVAGLRAGVKQASGEPVPVVAPKGEQTYSLGARKGLSVFAFELTEDGRYTLEFDATKDMAQPAVLTLSSGAFAKMVGMVLKAVAFSTIAVIGGVLIAVLAFISDRKAFERSKKPLS